jgi:cytidylate kinase
VRVIAIDGPAGAGKSTVARAVAERLGLAHLDTGAMYRSVAWASRRAGIDPGCATALARLARQLDLEVDDAVRVDGHDVTADIRGRDVTAVVSAVAANPEVRAEMVERQRAWVKGHGGGVVEGRDIGSVVFPGADLKVFLTAHDSERARRRMGDLLSGMDAGTDVSAVSADLARRDHLDANRAVSPLAVPEGALVIDTTGRTVEEVVEEILRHVPAAGPGGGRQ